MAVLKAEEFAGSGQEAQVFSLGDIAEEARAIVASAERERDRILAEAEAESRRVLEEARQTGLREGREKGHAEGRTQGQEQALKETREQFDKDSSDLMTALRQVLEEFDRGKHAVLWRAEQGTVALALAIAEKVSKKAGGACEEVALENVKAALGLISTTTDVVVKISPKDLTYLETAAGKNDAVLGKYSSVSFEADEGVVPGGCILCTEGGGVDAQLDTQIQRIADELMMSSGGDSR